MVAWLDRHSKATLSAGPCNQFVVNEDLSAAGGRLDEDCRRSWLLLGRITLGS
jgi:hypothetical protein